MAKQKKVHLYSKKMSLKAPPEEKTLGELYDKDFYKWTNTQSKLLLKGEYSKLDIQNLVEEIKSLGKSDRRALHSQFIRLLEHLLKLQYTPERQENSNSWKNSVVNARRAINSILKDSPSLKNELKTIFSSCYEAAVENAAIESGEEISFFPKECPWDIKDLI